MPQKMLNLVKEWGQYELFCVRGFMFYGKATKIILDFEVEFFGHCSITFGIHQSFLDS
jgi:hypothetical protein